MRIASKAKHIDNAVTLNRFSLCAWQLYLRVLLGTALEAKRTLRV